MNKTIATAAITGAIILSPVASMGISPVREALLGLAPEEQIINLAEQIDTNRLANEQKLAENEAKLTELQELVAKQNETISTQQKALETTNSQVSKSMSQPVLSEDQARKKSAAIAEQERQEMEFDASKEEDRKRESEEKRIVDVRKISNDIAASKLEKPKKSE